MMIWLDIWSFIRNFNFDNISRFWKYPEVSNYSFEFCNFSCNFNKYWKLIQLYFFILCNYYCFLTWWIFEEEKTDRRNSGGMLWQKFNLTDIWDLTFKQWTNGPMDQWTNEPMDQWTNEPTGQWTNEPMNQ